MAQARRLRINGRVQGVFFRAWTREQARALGITGWVRNCPDGSVEALIEGSPNELDRLIEHLRRGPDGARVDDLQSEVAVPEGAGTFEVRH